MKSGMINNRLEPGSEAMSKMKSKSSISSIEYFLIMAAIFGLFMFLFGPVLHAKFYIVEDHHWYSGAIEGFAGLWDRIFLDAQKFQRFRPGYWIYISLIGKMYGTSPHLLHATVILSGILTCFLFYISLRKIGADMASSSVFVFFLVLSGNQNWIWLNLIPQETMGMLLTAVAVWAIVNASKYQNATSWDVLALAAMAAAGLFKESFVILMPALLLLRWTCQKRPNGESWRENLRRLRLPLATGAMIFVIEFALVMAVFLSKSEGYAAKASGFSVASFDPRRWLEIFSALAWDWKFVSVAVFVLWASLWFDKKFNRTYLLGGTAIFAAWLVPQVLLYTNGLNERYLFPAIASLSAAVGLGLSILLRKQRLWPLWIVGVLFLLPILANGVTSTTKTVGALTADTVAANRMIEFLAQNVPTDQTILMAADRGTGYGFEAMRSIPLLLKMAGSNSPLFLFPIESKGERSALHIAAIGDNTSFRYADTLTPADVGAVIIVDKWLPGFDSEPLAQWLGDTTWREINFIEPYYSFSFREFRFIKAGEVIHKILLLPSSGGVPSARPLIVFDHSLTGVVSANQWLDFPPWGLERDYAGSGSIVWLGEGDEEGLGGVLSSTREQSVNIDLEVVPGPSRSDYRRTVEFSLDNRAGQQKQREVFEGGKWKFNVKLQPGPNHFRLRILDKATISIQPNGDTRRLLALLSRMTLSSLEKD